MKQSSRLILTVAFLGILIVLGRFVTHHWFYLPSGDQSIWFQAGLLMVVLGSFFIEKHFVKPVDVVANVIAAIVTLLSLEHRENFLFWNVAFGILLAVGICAFLSMAFQTFSHSILGMKIARVLYNFATFVGSAKRLFSAVLFLAIFSYFEIPSLSAILVLIFWAIVVCSEPLGIPGFIDSFIDSIKHKENAIGKVSRILSPRFYQIELSSNLKIDENDLIEICSQNNKLIAVPISHFSLKDKKILNALIVSKVDSSLSSISSIVEVSAAKLVKAEFVSGDLKKDQLFNMRKHLIGYVEDNSNIEQLRFRLLRDCHLEEGHLVKVYIYGQPIIYQIINAITQSKGYENDEDRYVLVIGQQVGRWDEATLRFESIGWVAQPGDVVFSETGTPAINMGEIGDTRAIVGKLPNAEYPVHVEINDIVTHHTAILGITGSGKTFLAYDLIRKMVSSGIKVVIFDISTDYARDLADLRPSRLTGTIEITPFLEDANSNIAIAEFSPTSSETLVKATAISVRHVLDWAKLNLRSQQGENIKAKVCVVFEEAHSLIPEWNSVSVAGDKEEVNKVSQAILQGRKYGVGALVITQRTANITKTILNQCNTIFALQSFDQTGLEFLKNYIGEEHSQALSTLLRRQAVLFGKASSSRRPIIVKLNERPIV